MSYKAQYGTEAVALKKRVLYVGTDTIYKGMLLCYEYNTTENILGYDKGAGGWSETQTSPTTTADGYQNEGKFLRVVKPTDNGRRFFAGAVADGNWVGQTGPRWLEIFVPNGAIVPVRCNQSITALDALYVVNDNYNARTTGTFRIGTAAETADRSGTNGLILARLTLPDEVVEDTVATTAAVGPSAAIWNEIPLRELQTNFSAGILHQDDFMGPHDPTTAQGWTVTQVTTGALNAVAVEGGAVIADSAGNGSPDDGVNAQLLNCRVKPVAGRKIAFEARVKFKANTGGDQYFIGLAATKDALIASGKMEDTIDKVGFFREDVSTALKLTSISARTSADVRDADVVTFADDTYTTLGFVIDGLTSVKFYQNGVLVSTMATAASVPNAEVCLSLVAQCEQTAADAEMTVDWIRLAQYGARS